MDLIELKGIVIGSRLVADVAMAHGIEPTEVTYCDNCQGFHISDLHLGDKRLVIRLAPMLMLLANDQVKLAIDEIGHHILETTAWMRRN